MTDSTSTNLDDPDCLFWATKIRGKCRSSLEDIIGIGELFVAAKGALPHSKWGPFIHYYLPFKARTAQRLMAIAQDSRITNTTHAPYLPPNWTTLYVLTKLSDYWFQVGLRSKAIRPDMERADADDLLQRQRMGKRAKRDPELARSSNPSLLDTTRKAYVAECRMLSFQDRMCELASLASILLITDDEQIAIRQRRRENAEEEEFLIAESFAEMRQGPRHEQGETTS